MTRQITVQDNGVGLAELTLNFLNRSKTGKSKVLIRVALIGNAARAASATWLFFWQLLQLTILNKSSRKKSWMIFLMS